jgi:hypothetical protein
MFETATHAATSGLVTIGLIAVAVTLHAAFTGLVTIGLVAVTVAI